LGIHRLRSAPARNVALQSAGGSAPSLTRRENQPQYNVDGKISPSAMGSALADDPRLRTDDQSRDRSDELHMEEALRAAQRALEAGEVPVGAVVVCDGRVIATGWNQNLSENDPTAHAEVVALRDAGAIVGNHRLEDCDLFATIEPCAMCAGALIHARIRRLIYGADDPKAGAVQSVMQVLNHPQLNHRMEIKRGVLAGRCAELLQSFFRDRRAEKK
jgi:tRNA(adenine34) deaminase